MRAIQLWLLRRRMRAQSEWRRDLIDGIATGQALLRQCEERLDEMRARELALMPWRAVIKRAVQ